MKTFPIENISYTKAVLSGQSGEVSIEITIAPFQLKTDGDGESINTSIVLEGIDISSQPGELEGKTFDFPVNPEDGYIDGSIYFLSAHSPVDVAKIEFGKIESGQLPIKLKSSWALEFENTGFKNIETDIHTIIDIESC